MAKNVLVWENQGFNQQNVFLFAFKKHLFMYTLTQNHMAIEQPFDLDFFISGKNKVSTHC